jgi:hypothetical protein
MRLVISLKGYILKDMAGYGSELNGLAVGAGIPELVIAKPYLRFLGAYDKFNDGFKLSSKGKFTDLLLELDQKRGNSYRGLFHGVQSFLYSDVQAEVQAAKTLNVLFQFYGFEFTNGSYEGETGTLRKFIADLKKPENAAAIATLKLEAKVAQLVKDVDAFDVTYKDSLKDVTEQKNYVAATTVRNEFEKETQNFLSYLQGKLLEDSDPKWEVLCANIITLNERLEKNEAVRQAALKNKREEKKCEGQK